MKREGENDWWPNDSDDGKAAQPARMSERGYGIALSQVIGRSKPGIEVCSLGCPSCGTLLPIMVSDIREHKPSGNGLDLYLHMERRACSKCQAIVEFPTPVRLRMADT